MDEVRAAGEGPLVPGRFACEAHGTWGCTRPRCMVHTYVVDLTGPTLIDLTDESAGDPGARTRR